jgi:hypothetical protein
MNNNNITNINNNNNNNDMENDFSSSEVGSDLSNS